MSRLKGSVRTFLAVRGAVFVAAIVVLVLAAAIGGASIARGNNSTSPRPAQLATTDWPVNERGQTYGSDAKAQSEADIPDLVAAMATNVKIGYCLKSDMDAPPPELPKSAEEAEAMMRDALCKGRIVPVYESDGATQIGVFQIGGPGTTVVMDNSDGTIVTMTGEPDGAIVAKTTYPDGTTTTKSE